MRIHPSQGYPMEQESSGRNNRNNPMHHDSGGGPHASSAQSATAPAEGRETPHRRAATPPKECELCVPVVRIVEDNYFLTITEAGHEHGCPNHPSKRTQFLKESPHVP